MSLPPPRARLDEVESAKEWKMTTKASEIRAMLRSWRLVDCLIKTTIESAYEREDSHATADHER